MAAVPPLPAPFAAFVLAAPPLAFEFPFPEFINMFIVAMRPEN